MEGIKIKPSVGSPPLAVQKKIFSSDQSLTATNTKIQAIMDAAVRVLDGKRTSTNKAMVRCPCHDDQNPSLALSIDGGKLLASCHAGCPKDAVVSALKSRKLWPDNNGHRTPLPERPPGIPGQWHGKMFSSAWRYNNAAGEPIGYTVRYDGDGKKIIIPFFIQNGKNWKPGAHPEPRPLYGLDRLAKNPDAPILIVEGEKTADAARRLLGDEWVVITWPGGTGAVKYVDWSVLQNRIISLWPDSDDPGLKAVNIIEGILIREGVASLIEVMPPQDVEKGWDLADAEAEGWTGKMVNDWIVGHSTDVSNMDQTNTASGPKQEVWQAVKQLLPRRAFPWDVLPLEIADSLKKLARSCATTAEPLPGFAFAMMGAAVGRFVTIRMKPGWQEPLIFWFIDIQDSGEGKTAKMQALATVFQDLQRREHARAEAEQAEWDLLSKKEKEGKAPPGRPRIYYCTDLTLEGLRADLCSHPTGGIIVMLAEASALIGGQNEYKQNKGTDRESWLRLHDGHDAVVSRSTKSFLVRDGRVSVIGGIQPFIFRSVFGSGDGQYLNDGTAVRALYTYSPTEHHPLTLEGWAETDRSPWVNVLQQAFCWADSWLDSGADFQADGKEHYHVILLDDDAKNLFLEWRNRLDEEKTTLPPEIRCFLPKAYGAALRLAAAIDLIHCFYNNKEPRQRLDTKGMQRGIDAAMFYLGQAVDAVRLILGDELTTNPDRDKLLKMLDERGELTESEIYTDVFHRNRTSDQIKNLMQELIESGDVNKSVESTGGRPKTTYTAASKTSKRSKSPEADHLNVVFDLFEAGNNFVNDKDEIEI